MIKWFKAKVRNYLLRRLLASVVTENIIKIDKATKSIYLDGRELDYNQRKQLQEEIKFLTRTWIWDIFQNTLRHQAYKVMFDKSTNYDDMISGKMMLYNLDVQKNIVDKLST